MRSNPALRRRHRAELKAKGLATCNDPGASIAAVALSYGLIANLVRKWLVGRGPKRTGIAVLVAVKASASAITPPTCSLPMPSSCRLSRPRRLPPRAPSSCARPTPLLQCSSPSTSSCAEAHCT